jgi:hypothetical protein
MKRIIVALFLIATTNSSNAYDFSAGTGALSYTFFNLTGNTCSPLPFGSSANSNVNSGSKAYSQGWGNGPYTNGFFNNVGLGGNENNPSNQVAFNYVFFNNADPISTPATPNPLTSGSGSKEPIVESSTVLQSVTGNELINPAAMADSWSINCGTGVTITTANMASSSSLFQSGTAPSPSDYPYSAGTQPHNPGSLTAAIPNALLNPVTVDVNESECGPDSVSLYSTNPCGMGFTQQTIGSQNYNLNVQPSAPNYLATGGLWSGVYYSLPYGSTSLSAINTLNPAMLPVNLSAYAVSQAGVAYPSSVNSEYLPTMSYTSIYGGHFTYAVGDPFVISSFAAKALAFLVEYNTLSTNSTQNAYASIVNCVTLGFSNCTTIAKNGGVFQGNTVGQNYVDWLFNSPSNAASAYQGTVKAASVVVDNKSLWGKIFSGIADVAVYSGISALAFIPGGDVAVSVVSGGAFVAGGALVPDMNSAIDGAFTSQANAPPPQSQNAPAVVNDTYAAGDLLGLLLTNVGVQTQIDATLGSSNLPPPLISNYTAYIDSQCGNTLEVTSNLFSGNCSNLNGGQQSENSSFGGAPNGTYNNVFASNQVTNQLSIWDAILTGSDVTTNDSGYLVMGNSVQGATTFSPPVQIVNATNGSNPPTSGLPNDLSANTTFNLNTGVLTLASYSGASGLLDPVLWSNQITMPTQINIKLAQQSAGQGISFTGPYNVVFNDQYVSVSGYVGNQNNQYNMIGLESVNTTTNFPFANGTQSLRTAWCPPNSSILLTITPDPTNVSTPEGASGSLSCQANIAIPPANQPTLNYSQCVNDPWATGGVVVAVTSAPNLQKYPASYGNAQLACTCMPSYLAGPSLSSFPVSGTTIVSGRTYTYQVLNSMLLGATSLYPDNRCPPGGN